MINVNRLNTIWYLVIACIGAEYISKMFFLLEIFTILGLLTLFKNPNFHINRIDIKNIIYMTIIMFGLIISRINVSSSSLLIMNMLFLIKMFLFFLFVYFFITRYGFPFKTLYVMSLFVIPHFIGYIIGINLYLDNQFAGFHGDPNYLSPDLLSSFAASLFLVKSKKIRPNLRLIFFFILLISFFLLLLTVSRTAFLAIFLIFLILILKSTVNFKGKFLYKFILIGLIGFTTISLISETLSKNISYTPLYKRFFESDKGANLEENERYLVWGISYNSIQDSGLFQGYSIDKFLKNKYHFVSHNAWLDIGIKEGSYTFWVHSVFYSLFILKLTFKYLKSSSKINVWSIKSFLLVFILSISFMMFSISVSHMYYYWFILYLLFLYGFMHNSKNSILNIRM